MGVALYRWNLSSIIHEHELRVYLYGLRI